MKLSFKNLNEKGTYGYMEGRKSQYFTWSLVSFLAMAAFIAAGILIWHTRKNLLMVPGLLLVIPFANFISVYISLAAGSHDLPAEKREALRSFEEAGMLLYHLMYCDEKGKRHYMDVTLVYQNAVISYCSHLKAERKTDIETDCITRFKKKGIPLRLKVYTDWDEFLKRCETVEPAVPEAELVKVEKAMEQFMNLCL